MNNSYKNIFLLTIFLFSSSVLYTQVGKKKLNLSEILTLLQEQHNYNFTYAHDVIKPIRVVAPKPTLTLKETINYLEKETGLIFQFLENNIITIHTKNNIESICGYLVDNETKIPIENATIKWKENYAISDSFGYFNIAISNTKGVDEEITIRHLSYDVITFVTSSFTKEGCSNIYLTPSIEAFGEVLITNYIAKGIHKLADGSISINFSNFGILPGLIETDVLQTVQALPGIQSVNETVSDINIRGGTNDQNLLLWDGIKMYQSGHFFGLISIFNPLITTDVSIIKNGTTAAFTDGVSGTIAMKSDIHINDIFKASIGINFINTDAFFDLPLSNKSSLQLAIRKAINPIVETLTYTNYAKRILQNSEAINTDKITNKGIAFDFYDTSLRWLYKISDKDQIRLNFINIENELVFTENAKFNQTEQSRESNLSQNSIAGGFFYKRIWSNSLTTTAQMSESGYKLMAINADIFRQRRLLQENKVVETSIKLNNYYKYNNLLSFLAGYHFTETIVTNVTDVDNPFVLLLNKEVIREHSIFSEVTYLSESKKTNIKTGVRYNFIEKFKKHIIEPRFSLNQKLFNNLSFELLGELKHQNLSQIINFQNDFLGIEKRRWQLSNPANDIPIITSKQVSAGFNYTKKGWLFSIEGYLKNVKGITSQSQGFLNQYVLERVSGDYKVKGVDFLVNYKTTRFSSWLSYSHADNEYTFKSFEEINFPNNIDIRHSFSFGSSFSTDNLKVSAGFNWHSGKPTTSVITGNEIINDKINYELANSSNLQEYIRIDASVIYKFNLTSKIKAQTGVSIWNGLNHENLTNSYYMIGSNNTTNKVYNKALRFTPNFSFKVIF